MDTALSKQLSKDDLIEIGRKLVLRARNHEGAMADSFLPKREKYQKWADGNYEDRKTSRDEDIFSKNNIPLEFITGVAEFMIARTCDDIFGSEPFYAVIPQGERGNDPDLADQILKHSQYKLREARFKEFSREAIKNGYHLGEGIQKTTWRREVDEYQTLSMVLVQGGAEVITEDGDYIYDTDHSYTDETLGISLWGKESIEPCPPDAQFQPVPDLDPLPILVGPDGPLRSPDGFWYASDQWYLVGAQGAFRPEEGDMIPEGSPCFLSKGQVVAQTPDMGFEERLIDEQNILFEGIEKTTIRHGDFFAPLNVPCLSKAEFIGHRLTLKLSELRQNYGLDPETEELIGPSDEKPKAQSDRPIIHLGEQETRVDACDEEDPSYECVECYTKLMVGGKMRRIFALVDMRNEVVIAIDYWANVTPKGILPFSCCVPCPVPGRWYGRGYHEIYESENEFIDRTFNAIVYRNKVHANPTGFYNPDALKDEAAQKNLVIGYGKLYRVKANTGVDGPPLSFVEYPDLDQRSQWIMELVIQMVQVRSGVTGAAQGAMSNLPADNTATGVQSIMLSGSTLHKLPIECCKEGLQKALYLDILTLYANQNTDETFTYLEGDAQQVMTLNAETVKGLDLNVQLLLTRMQEREALESAKAAIEAVNMYMQTPEAEKDGVRPLYVQVLKALHIQGADAILRKGLPPEGEQGIQNESLRVQMNYKDAPEDVKRQMESDAGYQPSTLPPPPPESPTGDRSIPEEQAAPPKPENAE